MSVVIHAHLKLFTDRFFCQVLVMENARVGQDRDGGLLVQQVVKERVVMGYIDVVGFDFHSYGEIEPSRDVVASCIVGSRGAIQGQL